MFASVAHILTPHGPDALPPQPLMLLIARMVTISIVESAMNAVMILLHAILVHWSQVL
jgi:hypothetical protein